MGNRLIDERPLIVLPSLVALFDGDYTRAILVQQIHFLSQVREGVDHGGHKWIKFTYAEMCEDSFKWMAPDSLGASVRKLESDGVLLSKSRLENKWDASKYYRLNMAIIEGKLESNPDAVPESTSDAVFESTIEDAPESTISYIDCIETTNTDKDKEIVAADAAPPLSAPVEVVPEDDDNTETHQQWFEAICWCCGYDHKVIAKKDAARVGISASKLRKHYTLSELRYWYTEIWPDDWRGKKGGRPTPEQIAETIGRMGQPDPTENTINRFDGIYERLIAEGVEFAA